MVPLLPLSPMGMDTGIRTQNPDQLHFSISRTTSIPLNLGIKKEQTVASQTLTGPAKTPSVPPAFPFLDLGAQFAGIRDEVMDAITKTMNSQRFILGPEVEQLESEIAKYVGCKFAIACASGSDALMLALMALQIGPGDDVITSPFTFVATAGAVARVGAKPVFVDIDPVTYNLDAVDLSKAVTSKTRAVIPVHLYGLPADMDAILAVA